MVIRKLGQYKPLRIVILTVILASTCFAQAPTPPAASETLTVSVPLGLSSLDFQLAVGDEALLSWTGGEFPYSIRIINGAEAVDVASGQQFGIYSWVVNVPPGTDYQVEVEDKTGYVATSEHFVVVTASSTHEASGFSGYATPSASLDLPGYESDLQTRKSLTARATSMSKYPNWSKTSSASSAAPPTAVPASSGSLATSTKIGIAMGGVAVGLFLAALAGILLWRRRKSLSDGRQDSSFTAAGGIDTSPAIDPFPYHPERPMTSTTTSLASGAQPVHPGLLQQYSSGSNVAYLHPSPQTTGQPGYFAGPPPMPSPTPSTSAQTGFLPSSSSAVGDLAGSVSTSETAQDRREAKARLVQAVTPAQQQLQQQQLVIQETDSGAVGGAAIEPERLPPSYDHFWGGQT